MKRNIIFLVAVIVVLILTLGIFNTTRVSKTPVNFTLPEGARLSVLDKDSNVISEATESKTIGLEEGVYLLEISASDDQVVSNENITVLDYGIDYTVKEPEYKESYLLDYLKENKQEINKTVDGLKQTKETINNEAMFGSEGRFYYLLLLQSSDGGATRRVLLENDGGNWKLLGEPTYIISKYDIPDYAEEAAKAVNNLELIIK